MFLFILSRCSLPNHPLFEAFTEGKKSKGVAQWKQLIQKTGFELWSFALLYYAQSPWSAYRLSCRWALDVFLWCVGLDHFQLVWMIISHVGGHEYRVQLNTGITKMAFSAFFYTELLIMTEWAVTALKYHRSKAQRGWWKAGLPWGQLKVLFC